jgi:hypothetical protein
MAELLQGSTGARVSGGTWSAEADETRWVRALASPNCLGSVLRASPIFTPPLLLVCQCQHVQPAEGDIRHHHHLYSFGRPLLCDYYPRTRTPRKATIGLWCHQSITHCLFQNSYIRLYVTIQQVITFVIIPPHCEVNQTDSTTLGPGS